MKDKFKIADLNTENFREGAVSKQLYSVVSRWVSFAVNYYKDWDYKPRCGHFFGGSYNYEVETSAAAMAACVTACFGDYNSKIAGVSKKRLIEMAINSIRYLCYTHHTGPADCVREKSRNPVTSGKKWGYKPGNFFMSSQTGVGVSMMGLSVWLLWEKLDEETKEMAATVIEFYADEYCEMTPGSGVYNDTQCEENAWTSLGLATAYYMFPDHPHSQKWLDGYIKWSLNSVTTYKDKLENELDKVNGKTRGGFVHNEKTYGISSVTFHPDFTTENHGYVHPDYMGSGIGLNPSSVIFPLLKGETPIGSIFFNVENLYNRVLKPWCTADGNPVAVQGQDWFYHRHPNKLFMHTVMNLFFNDADAAMFERKCIDITVRRQMSTGNGRLLEKNGEMLEVTPGSQSAFDMEYGSIRTVVLSYLLHLAKGDGIKPEEPEQVMKKFSGNYMYPYGGVYIYRTPETFTSFTTRCSIMGLSLPKNGLWDATSDFQGFTGIIKEKNSNDGYYADKKINWRDIGIETIRENILEYDRGFSIIAEVPRAGKAIMQASSFSALPDGKSVYVEKSRAVRDVDIAFYDTGKVTIGNENFEYMPEYARGNKNVYFDGEKIKFFGNYDGEDVCITRNDLRYVNVDDKLGYVLYGSSGVEYLNRHKYAKWKGLEDTLILNKRKPLFMNKGDATEIFAVTIMPNKTNSETEYELGQILVTCSEDELFVKRINENRVTVNFSDKKVRVKENISSKDNKVAVFNGITKVIKGNIHTSFYMNAFTSCIDTVQGVVRFLNETAEINIVCANGVVAINNKSDRHIEYVFISNGVESKITQQPGEAVEFTV